MQKLTLVLVLALAFFGSINSQRITIPLNIQEDKIFFTVTYGHNKCTVNVTPSIDYCANIIQESATDNCGSQYIRDNSFILGKDYIAPFQLGDVQAQLYYIVPNSPKSQFYGAKELCFGIQNLEDQRNALQELFQEGQLTEERVYFHLKNSSALNKPNKPVGEIDIGAPNKKLIKKGSKLIELSNTDEMNQYSAYSNLDLYFFGQKLDSRNDVFFTLSTPFYQFTNFAFDNILEIFQQKGIDYTLLEDVNSTVYLPSIEGLVPIELTLLEKDNTPLVIKIKPEQYTRQLADGTYQLLIQPNFYTRSIQLGYTIFDSYYIGFDLPHKTVLIAERAEEQVSNFRGYSNIDE